MKERGHEAILQSDYGMDEKAMPPWKHLRKCDRWGSDLVVARPCDSFPHVKTLAWIEAVSRSGLLVLL